MAKQSKRTRKFEAKGGVKARLEKGTITNKGKLKRKRKGGGNNNNKGDDFAVKKAKATLDRHQREEQRKKAENDFMSQENLGELDIEKFFQAAIDNIEKDKDDDKATGESESAEVTDHTSSSSDDDDDEQVVTLKTKSAPKKKATKSRQKEKEEEEKKKNDKKKKQSIQDSDDSSDDDSSDGDSDDDDDDDGSSSDSDNEDIDAAAERMKKEMEKLHKSDPDFHKFLSENEQSLLDFDEPPTDEPTKSNNDKDGSLSVVEVTFDVLKKLEQGAFWSHGVKGLKKLVRVYKVACHLSDASSPQGKTAAEDEEQQPAGTTRYHIDSSDVYDQLMVMALERCHTEFRYHLLGKGSVQKTKTNKPTKKGKQNEDDDDDDDDDNQEEEEEGEEEGVDDKKPIQPKKLTRGYRWNDLRPIMQTFMNATLHVLSEAKEPELLTFVLKALSKYIPLLTPFPKVAQHLLKSLTGLWSAPLDSSEDYQVVRLNAFLRIRQMALTQPFPFIEDCLKKTYLAYAKRAKYGTSATVTSVLPTLTFMGNCVVELYGLDYHSSYQHAFVYIRQLALHLRLAMQKKTPESFQVVYCWQYIHCLKLWVAVVTSACQADDPTGRPDEIQMMESIIYPLTEVILGVIRLLPTTRHLPLRLHCVRYLQQLAATTENFIPTTGVLLEVFDLKEMYMKPKHVKKRGGGGAKTFQLPLMLRLPKDDTLRTAEQLEACVSEVFLLLNREADLYRYSPGFPEFTFRICQRLRKVRLIFLDSVVPCRFAAKNTVFSRLARVA